MINKTNLNSLFLNNPVDLSTNDFIKIHKGVEGYLYRLLFIGLRLNDIKYETALKAVNLSYLDSKTLLQKTICMLSKNTLKLSDFEVANSDFKELVSLFFEFTVIYRNRLAHGVIEEIFDEDILKHCYYIDKYFMVEFENTLQLLGYKSAFDTPTAWGANKITSSETFESVIDRLKIGSLSKVPKGIIAVKNAVSRTKYNGQI
jgi:hypothetical protein